MNFRKLYGICILSLALIMLVNDANCIAFSFSDSTGPGSHRANATRQISIAEGLPSSVITAIIKDDDGFVWIGTPRGLCRWDGFRTIVYSQNHADSNSLIGNQISRNGLIWNEFDRELVIGTKEGISMFNPQTGIFKNHYVSPGVANALQSPVNNVYTDRQGILWAGTDQGFARFSQGEDAFHTYTFSGELPDGIVLDRNSANQIFDIKQDYYNDSVLWLASLAGLLKFNKHTEILKWFYFPDTEYLRDMNLFTLLLTHPESNLYIGTWNLDMAVFDTRSEAFTDRFGPVAPGSNKLQNRILPYQVKSKNELWVSSLQGLGILNTTTGKIEFYKAFKNEKGHRFAPELFYMDKGQYWLGSEYGVFILNTEKKLVSNYFFDPMDEDHWYLTNCITENPQSNELLIGYGRGEGLHVFNRTDHQFRIIPYPRRSIQEYNIIAMLNTGPGDFLVLSADEIYSAKENDRKLIPLNSPYANFPAFTDMKMDKEGSIWVASTNLGLQRFDPADNSLKSVWEWSTCFETGHELPLFSEICIDPENRVWFRRRGESYGYYDPAADTVHYFTAKGQAFDLTSFANPVNDTLWVATADDGLGLIDTKNPDKGVQLVFSSDKMKVGILHNLIVDRKNQIWGLAEKGLVKINKRTGQTILFDEQFGISVHDSWSNKNALIPGELKILSDGSMVIGYRRGLGFFQPDSLAIIHNTPEPYFIDIRIFDKSIPWDGAQLIPLKHNENYVTFSYSALDLYHDGVTFRHKLMGVDKDWKENPPDREATYSNLLPGNYIFKVETISKSGFGDKKEILIEFRILPPWWKTVWAAAVLIVLISASLFTLYRFQLRRQLVRREAQRLRELDELKTRLYANITHEFRTPITVIMGLAEELSNTLNGAEKDHFTRKLETIQRNGGNLLHLVNQMLDLAKLEHGKLNYHPIQANVIPWLQYIVESHQSLAGARDIQLTFYSETEALLMDYDPDQLSKVVSNLLTNAIKFTGDRGKVICHVKHEPADSSFLIRVKDTGRGIPESEQSKIFDRFYQVESAERQNHSGTGIGLSLTREIVELIGGIISVKSQHGKGSEFDVTIPVTRIAPESPMDIAKFQKPLVQRPNHEPDYEKAVADINGGQDKALVLIAEDNPDVAGYIRDTIRMNYKVKWASDGDKAVQMAFDLIPDLVISDVMMPGKDGFEVCNILKTDERTDHIPVIMLTAKVADSDRIAGYKRGADAYLTKPFNKNELLVRLEQLLMQRRQLQAKFSKLNIGEESDKPIPVEEQFIRKAAQIVEANLEKSMFNAADLAREVHLSESQLYRKLKAISGKSSAIFIRTVRLKKSRELLATSSLSISEIAYQVGFNDPAWFSRIFKEEYGVSPTEAKSNNKFQF